MPVAALAAALCLSLACGVRPAIDFTDIKLDLDVAKKEEEIDADCALPARAWPLHWPVPAAWRAHAGGELKKSLEQLGIHGEGHPCEWLGVECEEKSCRVLAIDSKDAYGSLSVVRGMTGLRSLVLSSTGVTGDLEILRNLTSLQELNLGNTGVRGDIESLRSLSELWKLDLSGTEVRGDLEILRNLTSLQDLYLENTGVRGDIESLRSLSEPREVNLDNTGVSGDLENLKHLMGLWQLRLQNTGVTGDLANLQHLTVLGELRLQNTGVSGDIENLHNLTNLKYLHLGNTGVQGDIQSLEKLAKLKELCLDDTGAEGDIKVLLHFPALEVAKLRSTAVTGWISDEWNGQCAKLRELHLEDSQVGPVPPVGHWLKFFTSKPLLPALQLLNVSGCPLNGSLKDLLIPLANTPLATIAASNASLTGEVPDLAAVEAQVDYSDHSQWKSKLSQTLQTVDMSSNSLTSLATVPAGVRVEVRSNVIPLRVAPSALDAATRRQVEVWLEGTKVANPEQLEQLLPNELQLQEKFTKFGDDFACRALTQPWLRITPELFMPQHMCGCRTGHKGHGTSCSRCPADSFSNEVNSTQCTSCPPGSNSTEASESWSACECSFGQISEAEGGLRCQCPAGQALVASRGSEHCEPCSELHLQCPQRGSNATTANVSHGYARLEANSSKVFQCLEKQRCTPSGCGAGFAGALCSDCEQGYRRSKNSCQQCTDLETVSSKRMAFFGLCGAGVLGLLGAAAWSIRRYVTFDLRCSCAVDLIEPQLTVLLQLAQLWSVLRRLAQPLQDDVDLASNATVANGAGDELLSLEAFQLTSNELQNFVALQCIFEGTAVRVFFATATPLMPLALLLACCFLEIFSKGMGIRIALKIVTVLFIGGAAGAAQLLSCQMVDGSGKRPLGDFAFRPLMPHLQCKDEKWVDWIGHACATCYGVVIPLFLALLFAKQHLTMRQCKTFIAQSYGKEEVTLQLQVLNDAELLKEDAKRKRLVAAAAAYVAVYLRGRVLVGLKKDAVTVKMIQHGDEAGDFEADFSEHLVYEEPSLLRSRRKMIQHNAMVQMLMERTVLTDIQSTRSDRIMLGASQLLCKYVNCSFVWMEVCMKLASAALVSVVGSKDGFWLSGAILLGMALVVGIARPFARPQVNALQTSCFACLALAALGFHLPVLGFHLSCRRLAYLALALPVLQLLLSLLRPDSSQALALRLHKELEEKLLEGPAEVSAEDLKFL